MTTTVGGPGSPWHAGEIALQRRIGAAERMDDVGRRVVRDHLIEQHRDFYPLLPFVVLGAVDATGDAWATLRAGVPGFLHSPDPRRLHVGARRDRADPADNGMNDGDAIGLLGIALDTRRRNRLNGTIRRSDDAGFDIAVGQSYGNCPQYIQRRQFAFARDPSVAADAPPQWSEQLDDDARVTIARADTFFVASYVDRDGGARQVDVSHRGGKPGFVHVDEHGVLTIPDFAGNRFFNTLGNVVVNPRAGLVFVDFDSGDLLQLTGDAEVVRDAPQIAAFQGAELLWRLTPRRIARRAAALPLRWATDRDGASPNSLLTGDWDAARSRAAAAALASAWRPFRVARTVDESATIRSLYLEPADGAGVVAPLAGQHLPIRVRFDAHAAPVVRTYTLSSAAADGAYRISVKRAGRVSTHLHALRAGDTVETRAPAGAFTLDAREARPAVLVAAGVGVTPIVAMLRHIVYEGARTRRTRKTWVFHAARSTSERAFDAEIAALVAQAPDAIRVVRALTRVDGADHAADYDIAGRLDADAIRAALPSDGDGDYDVYLCGPPDFTQSIYDGLRRSNVDDARIHAEAFGPSSLRRSGGRERALRTDVARGAVPVVFARSKKGALWQPASGTLLDFAEAQDLAPEFSCRGGSCGTCRTRITAGAVAYASPPAFPLGDDEALICCALPAAEQGGATSLTLDA